MEQRTLESLRVTKANELAQAGTDLTLVEAKVLEYCISTIYKDQIVTCDDVFEIDIVKLSSLFNISKRNSYRELKAVFTGLLSKVVVVQGSDGEKVTFQWLSALRSNDNITSLAIQFNPIICGYLSPERLSQGKFTAYPLEHIAGFSYIHSISLYNLCRSNDYKGAGYRTVISVEELREFLFLESGDYKLWGDLKRQIAKCLAEILVKTGLDIRLVERKKGRKVVGLEFEGK